GILTAQRTHRGHRRHPGPVTAATRPSSESQRVVSSHLEIEVSEEADLVLAVAVCSGHSRHPESLLVRHDGGRVGCDVIDADHGGRLHLLRSVAPGTLVIDYEATVQ